MKKKHILYPLLCICTIASAVYIYLIFQRIETDDAQIDAKITPIISRLDAFVDSVYITDHCNIKRGDTLIQLDTIPFILDIHEIEAQINGLRSKLQSDSVILLGKQMEYKIQTLRQNEISTEYWQIHDNFQRTEKMFSNNASTLDNYNESKAKDLIYDNKLKGQKLVTQKALIDLNDQKEQIRITKAQIKETLIKLRKAYLSLSYTTIVAPYAGKIYKVDIKKGQFIKQSQLITELTDNQNIWVTANFKETKVAYLQHGKHVSIEVDAYPDIKLNGYIDSYSPATGARFALFPKDNATGNFIKVVQRVPVKILFDKNQNFSNLIPGLNVNVRVID
ncbi:HlyD family secretion protein [Halosquirtibacter xylanolyticus]|uniref:HlyD family secretion protein n=1 Tax=Halosquirtibacter xylanolyticus TaxID=3374599 RepID=UPI0037499FAE|nr:HlyD family secretion protein [Prolixibacteraceae bacterium]